MPQFAPTSPSAVLLASCPRSARCRRSHHLHRQPLRTVKPTPVGTGQMVLWFNGTHWGAPQCLSTSPGARSRPVIAGATIKRLKAGSGFRLPTCPRVRMLHASRWIGVRRLASARAVDIAACGSLPRPISCAGGRLTDARCSAFATGSAAAWLPACPLSTRTAPARRVAPTRCSSSAPTSIPYAMLAV